MKRRVLSFIILFLISINFIIPAHVDASTSDYAILSDTQFYIFGYRVPYVLEYKDNYYVKIDYLEDTDFVCYWDWENKYAILDHKFEDKKWHNLQWKSVYKVGDKIGKVTKSKAMVSDFMGDNEKALYMIKQYNYVNIADLSSDKYPLNYDEKSNSYYMGTLPKEKLKTDTIYKFLMKAIGKKASEEVMLKKAHDYEAFNIKYSFDESDLDIDGDITVSQLGALAAVDTNSGICREYSELYKEMCDRMMIPCEIITGTSVKSPAPAWSGHAWNKVYVNDEWKYVDVTWDYSAKYKKISDVKHTYFLLSKKQMAKDHFNWEEE